MKQKYAIIRDDEQRTVMIREYAELDKEMMSLLCEESYPQDAIAASIKEGHQAVVDVIRTNNMYPPTVFAGPIASAIEGLFKEGGNLSAELFFDDKELFPKRQKPPKKNPTTMWKKMSLSMSCWKMTTSMMDLKMTRSSKV